MNYLFTGENRGFPTYHKNSETPTFRAEADYLYRHIKRETERGAAIFRSEEKDEIKGAHVTAKYPFGSIDYGFFPLTQEELIAKLETVEPYHYSFLPTDVPELQNNRLPIDMRTVDCRRTFGFSIQGDTYKYHYRQDSMWDWRHLVGDSF